MNNKILRPDKNRDTSFTKEDPLSANLCAVWSIDSLNN